MMELNFVLNGKNISLDTEPGRRVIDLLREDLGMTGAKEGCGSGECGACTILVDGQARLSCLMLTPQLEGKNITTIEGVSEDGIHKVQEAFIEKGAAQCGFCTPGMVLTAVDLLERNPHPSREDIKTAISGNICRCGNYVKVIDAVKAASLKPEDKGK
jgi:carbon-monoxide dehydrogenase small subunit